MKRLPLFVLMLLTVVGQAAEEARRGMVAAVHHLASEAGVAIMRQGGNAVDAAVVTGLVLGVVDSHNSGLGGGCFMLIRLPSGEVMALDGRETAPAASTPDMFVRNGHAVPDLSRTGALAAGVPGQVAVFHEAVTRLCFAHRRRRQGPRHVPFFPRDLPACRRVAAQGRRDP